MISASLRQQGVGMLYGMYSTNSVPYNNVKILCKLPASSPTGCEGNNACTVQTVCRTKSNIFKNNVSFFCLFTGYKQCALQKTVFPLNLVNCIVYRSKKNGCGLYHDEKIVGLIFVLAVNKRRRRSFFENSSPEKSSARSSKKLINSFLYSSRMVG